MWALRAHHAPRTLVCGVGGVAHCSWWRGRGRRRWCKAGSAASCICVWASRICLAITVAAVTQRTHLRWICRGAVGELHVTLISVWHRWHARHRARRSQCSCRYECAIGLKPEELVASGRHKPSSAVLQGTACHRRCFVVVNRETNTACCVCTERFAMRNATTRPWHSFTVHRQRRAAHRIHAPSVVQELCSNGSTINRCTAISTRQSHACCAVACADLTTNCHSVPVLNKALQQIAGYHALHVHLACKRRWHVPVMRFTATFERNVLLRDREVVRPVHVSPIAVALWQRLGQEANVEAATRLERCVYFNYREIVERARDIRKPWVLAFVRVG